MKLRFQGIGLAVALLCAMPVVECRITAQRTTQTLAYRTVKNQSLWDTCSQYCTKKYNNACKKLTRLTTTLDKATTALTEDFWSTLENGCSKLINNRATRRLASLIFALEACLISTTPTQRATISPAPTRTIRTAPSLTYAEFRRQREEQRQEIAQRRANIQQQIAEAQAAQQAQFEEWQAQREAARAQAENDRQERLQRQQFRREMAERERTAAQRAQAAAAEPQVDECPICLEHGNNAQLGQFLPLSCCGKPIHTRCYDQAMANNPSCPCCRHRNPELLIPENNGNAAAQGLPADNWNNEPGTCCICFEENMPGNQLYYRPCPNNHPADSRACRTCLEAWLETSREYHGPFGSCGYCENTCIRNPRF